MTTDNFFHVNPGLDVSNCDGRCVCQDLRATDGNIHTSELDTGLPVRLPPQACEVIAPEEIGTHNRWFANACSFFQFLDYSAHQGVLFSKEWAPINRSKSARRELAAQRWTRWPWSIPTPLWLTRCRASSLRSTACRQARTAMISRGTSGGIASLVEFPQKFFLSRNKNEPPLAK